MKSILNLLALAALLCVATAGCTTTTDTGSETTTENSSFSFPTIDKWWK